ncbi:hypothetical protein F9948_21775 [Burkholderia thailandensis]|nr:hypothetical protein [Burkholderia thailandensis]MDD1488828.1 hypothetical protein [Burkholderia thailandensis]MDD1494994.1 hypothetical protein [Burkholderia thailandensis]
MRRLVDRVRDDGRTGDLDDRARIVLRRTGIACPRSQDRPVPRRCIGRPPSAVRATTVAGRR